MYQIPLSQIKLRAASGTASLSAVKVFDAAQSILAGGDGSLAVASIASNSWQTAEALLTASNWTSNVAANAVGLIAVVAGAPVSVSYAKDYTGGTQDGAVVTYAIGDQIRLGTIPDFFDEADISVPSAAFTRPNDTTAYAAGDLVANSTTAGSVTPMQFSVGRLGGASGMVRRARIKKSGANSGTFRLHLFKTSPTVTNGDNGAFLPNNAANYIGALAVNADRVFSDGVVGGGVPLNGSEMNFVLPAASTVLYGLLEATAATTPAAQEVFTLELEVIRV